MIKRPVKSSHLLIFTASAALLGLLLRIWLYTTAVDEKGLLITSHPAGIMVFILTALVVAALAYCVIRLGTPPAYNQLFPVSTFAFFGNLLSAAGFLISGILRLSEQNGLLSILSFIVSIAAAGSLVYIALCRQKQQHPSMLFHGILTISVMLHIVSQYRTWSTEVQLQNYFFPLMASVTCLLAAYHRTALDVRTGSRKWYVFSNQAALFFSTLCLPNDNMIFYLSIAIWSAANLCSLRSGKKGLRIKNGGDMQLPDDVLTCIRLLENAGFSAYAVGGCVRDSLLGITPADYDLCTNATPLHICRVFGKYELIRNGEKHGTIGVIINGKVYEITTFRTEGSYSDNRHPDSVEFVANIEEDLRRRDFTVNAIAYAPGKGYIDPFGGRKDLEQQILRTVGDPAERFHEDALRILRGVRFSVRFDLQPEAATFAAMLELAPLMDRLARERVFAELCKLLPLVNAEQLLRFSPVITQVIPELQDAVGFHQHSSHHAYDVYTHTAHVVAAVSDSLPLRWAALLHDSGKVATFTQDARGNGHFYGHAKISADIADHVLHRLRASTALREQVVFLVENHMLPIEPDKRILRRRIGEYGIENVRLLLQLQKADFKSKGTKEKDDSFDKAEAILEQIVNEQDCLTAKDLAITGRDILELGYEAGPKIGKCMTFLLHEVQNDVLPNRRKALLDAAQLYMKK